MTTQRSDEVTELVREGTRLLRQGKHIQAAELLAQAYEYDSADFDVALNLSAAYIVGKKFKLALPILEMLVVDNPKNGMIWTNLGAAYLGNPVLADEGAQNKAIEAFKRALTIDSNAPNIAYNIGLIYKDRKNKQQAIAWFEKALVTNSNDKDAQRWIERLQNV